MLSGVLDSSALIALANEEPGWQEVARWTVGDLAISSVNAAEAISKLIDFGASPDEARAAIGGRTLTVEPFTAADGVEVGLLRVSTKRLGLSLGDRACLVLAKRLGVPAITADRVWAKLNIGVEIRLIR